MVKTEWIPGKIVEGYTEIEIPKQPVSPEFSWDHVEQAIKEGGVESLIKKVTHGNDGWSGWTKTEILTFPSRLESPELFNLGLQAAVAENYGLGGSYTSVKMLESGKLVLTTVKTGAPEG